MRTYKKNVDIEKSFYYLGASIKRRKHAQIKPGISRAKAQDVRKRFNRIRAEEPDFTPLAYLTIYNVSKTRLDALEGEAKAFLEDNGFISTGNDHFEFDFVENLSRKFQYAACAAAVMNFAMEYCDAHNLKYTRHIL